MYPTIIYNLITRKLLELLKEVHKNIKINVCSYGTQPKSLYSTSKDVVSSYKDAKEFIDKLKANQGGSQMRRALDPKSNNLITKGSHIVLFTVLTLFIRI
jgi:hypothetical protein